MEVLCVTGSVCACLFFCHRPISRRLGLKVSTLPQIAFMALLLSGCGRPIDWVKRDHPDGWVGTAEVTSFTSVGGLVRFSGVMAGIAVDAASEHCREFSQKSALPLSFYKIGPDTMGRDQIMTFECK